MTDEAEKAKALADAASAEAINAAAIHAESQENARRAQMRQAISESEDRTVRRLTEFLRGRSVDDPETNNLMNVRLMANDIAYIKSDVMEIKESMKGDYVTYAQFKPVMLITYGLMGLLGTATVLSLIESVLKITPIQ